MNRTRQNVLRFGLPTALILLGSSLSVLAQTTGTITGTLRDPQGAVVPKASIVATHTATGASRSVISDSAGGYVVPLLPIGEYQVTVESPGFKKLTARVVLATQVLTPLEHACGSNMVQLWVD